MSCHKTTQFDVADMECMTHKHTPFSPRHTAPQMLYPKSKCPSTSLAEPTTARLAATAPTIRSIRESRPQLLPQIDGVPALRRIPACSAEDFWPHQQSPLELVTCNCSTQDTCCNLSSVLPTRVEVEALMALHMHWSNPNTEAPTTSEDATQDPASSPYPTSCMGTRGFAFTRPTEALATTTKPISGTSF